MKAVLLVFQENVIKINKPATEEARIKLKKDKHKKSEKGARCTVYAFSKTHEIHYIKQLQSMENRALLTLTECKLPEFRVPTASFPCYIYYNVFSLLRRFIQTHDVILCTQEQSISHTKILFFICRFQ